MWQFSNFTNGQGHRIRYGQMQAAASCKSSRGVLLILPGNGEPLEKYAEVAGEFSALGYTIYGMDWMGQGGSERYLSNPHKIHSRGFHRDVADLRQFILEIVGTNQPIDLLAMSRSGIALRYLHDYGDVIRRAVFVAPMLNIHTGIVKRRWLRGLARAMVWSGLGRRYIPGHGDFDPEDVPEFAENKSTSDPYRYRTKIKLFVNHPELATGGVTWRWLHEAFTMIARLKRPAYLDDITTPLLLVTVGDERVTDNAAVLEALKALPNAMHLHLPTSRHEPWQEVDTIRQVLFEAVVTFLYKA